MLAIRMQRTGRKGHAMFRMVVQESRLTPTSGKVVALLGSYDPHAKALTLNKEKTSFYLEHGAQPSERVARLIKVEGIKLPDWVRQSADKSRTLRNPEKLRKNQPKETAAPEAPAATDETPETVSAEAETAAAPAEAEAVVDAAPADDADKA